MRLAGVDARHAGPQLDAEEAADVGDERGGLGEPALEPHDEDVGPAQVRDDPFVDVVVQQDAPLGRVAGGGGERLVHHPVERRLVVEAL